MLVDKVKDIIYGEVIAAFKQKLDNPDEAKILYWGHAILEMSNDNITSEMLECCLADRSSCELIEIYYEFDKPIKTVFLCKPQGFPPFHVVCFCSKIGGVSVKTAYAVDPEKFKEDNKTRIRPKRD
jgi:hypothetical protein